MKCPWCNAELKEGAVYCDVCGEEIYMVPDFDPEIEDTCRETIESMTKGIFTGPGKNGTDKNDLKKSVKSMKAVLDKKTATDKNDKTDNTNRKKNSGDSVFHVLRFTLFAFLVAILIVAAVCIYFTLSSDNYLLSKADKAYEKGNYEKAEELYISLLEKDKYNSDLMASLAAAYLAEGKTADYEEELLLISDSSSSSEKQRSEAVLSLIDIYDKAGEYEKITGLIASCGIESIQENYSYYFAEEPEFDILPGTYDTTMTLSITSDCDVYVTIVHTVDGEESKEADNELFSGSIELSRGTYNVSAYCMNRYGIKSNTVSNEYTIELIPPENPVVLLPEGIYVSPQLIEVDFDSENYTLYYTVGGEDPDTDSQIYTGPIMLPSGITQYSFMCADENGLHSDVVSVTYDLEYEYEITPAVAKDLLTEFLMDKGTIVSYDGTMPDGGRMGLELRYFDLCNDSYCYLFEEVLLPEDNSADAASTNMDVFYAVDMLNGEISKIE